MSRQPIQLHHLSVSARRFFDHGFSKYTSFHEAVGAACLHLIRHGYEERPAVEFLADGHTPFHQVFADWCLHGSAGKGKGAMVSQAQSKFRAARHKDQQTQAAIKHWLQNALRQWSEKRSGATVRVLAAIAKIASEAGTTSPTMSLPQIAETAGIGSTTNPNQSFTPVSKHVKKLAAMGLIRIDHSGRSGGAFRNATRIHLVSRPMSNQFASTDGDANQKQETMGTTGTNYFLTNPPGVIEHGGTPPRIWCAPISIDELLHPLWEEHHGIGMTACSIWAVVRSFSFATTTTIAKATGRSTSQIRTLLQKLERHGLVTSSPDHHWQIIAKTIQELDVAAEGLGLTTQREKRRAINVARRANYSQVLEIRRQAWKEAQRVDWEWARFVDPQTGELVSEPFPAATPADYADAGLARSAAKEFPDR